MHRLLDAVGSLVSLAHGRARRDGDHDVRELPRPRLPHPDTANVDRRLDPRDRRERRLLGVSGRPIHEHVHVALHQTRRGSEDQNRDEERRSRIRARVTSAHEAEPDEHRGRPEQVTAEVKCARLQRGALVATRGTPGDQCPGDVDHDHDRDDHERVPGRLDAARSRAFRERREVLGLPVTVLVPDVRGTYGDPDGEERQQRRDEIRSRVQRLGDEAEAVRSEPGDELHRQQECRRNDGHERGSTLRAHRDRLTTRKRREPAEAGSRHDPTRPA